MPPSVGAGREPRGSVPHPNAIHLPSPNSPGQGPFKASGTDDGRLACLNMPVLGGGSRRPLHAVRRIHRRRGAPEWLGTRVTIGQSSTSLNRTPWRQRLPGGFGPKTEVLAGRPSLHPPAAESELNRTVGRQGKAPRGAVVQGADAWDDAPNDHRRRPGRACLSFANRPPAVPPSPSRARRRCGRSGRRRRVNSPFRGAAEP